MVIFLTRMPFLVPLTEDHPVLIVERHLLLSGKYPHRQESVPRLALMFLGLYLDLLNPNTNAPAVSRTCFLSDAFQGIRSALLSLCRFYVVLCKWLNDQRKCFRHHRTFA